MREGQVGFRPQGNPDFQPPHGTGPGWWVVLALGVRQRQRVARWRQTPDLQQRSIAGLGGTAGHGCGLPLCRRGTASSGLGTHDLRHSTAGQCGTGTRVCLRLWWVLALVCSWLPFFVTFHTFHTFQTFQTLFLLWGRLFFVERLPRSGTFQTFHLGRFSGVL